MKTSQALLICGCFAEGLEVAFEVGEFYFHLFREDEDGSFFFELSIFGVNNNHCMSMDVADIGVDDGFLRFDLAAELEIRVPLED